MTWQTWLAVIAVLLVGGVQYGLMVYTLRDLRQRPRVRGGNKVVWGLVILCLPIAGALAYTVYGPTSFLPRPGREDWSTPPRSPDFLALPDPDDH